MTSPLFYLDIRDYGGSPSVDNTNPLNAMMQDALAKGIKQIYVGGVAGNWNFDSQPNDVPGLTIFGDSPSSSVLVANFAGDFLRFLGNGSMGGGARNLSVVKAAGFAGGSGIKLVATNASSPDYSVFEDIDITGFGGTGTWDYALSMDGTQRTTIQGVRDVKFRNVDLFAGTSGAANLQNIVGCGFSDVSAFPAGGAAAGLFIGGGSSTNVFDNMNILDQLNISHATQIVFDGMIYTLNSDSTGSRCRLTGLCTSGPITSSNLQNSYVNFN